MVIQVTSSFIIHPIYELLRHSIVSGILYTQLQSSPLFHQIIGSLVIVTKSSIFLPCFSYFLAIFRKEVETLSRSPRKIILCSLAYLCICIRKGHTKITHSCWILPIARSHQPPSGSYTYGLWPCCAEESDSYNLEIMSCFVFLILYIGWHSPQKKVTKHKTLSVLSFMYPEMEKRLRRTLWIWYCILWITSLSLHGLAGGHWIDWSVLCRIRWLLMCHFHISRQYALIRLFRKNRRMDFVCQAP